jgi:hypothetical protein
MISGSAVRVDPDGTIEVAYQDAPTLIALGWRKVGERYIDGEGE